MPTSELQAYEVLLCSHLDGFVRRLRDLRPEHWDWAPAISAPTARTVAVHAWQWLMCDRQHIEVPNIVDHVNVPEPPDDTGEFCDAFEQEAERWQRMLRTMTVEELDRPLHQFTSPEDLNVRWFVGHMVQNVIYKHGQFSEIYFALGYDGTGPYSAPMANQIYDEMHAALGRA